MRYAACAIVCLMVLWSAFVLTADETRPADAEASSVGKKVDDISLRDFYGKMHKLGDYAASKLIVVAFLGNDCPLAQLYGPRLEALHQEYSDRGVTVLGINANVQDTPTGIAAYARGRGITFPILKDAGNVAADRFDAKRTPEVFVLDSDRVIRYRGRIDDQYGVGFKRKNADRRDVAVALDELLAGKTVSTPETDAVGCIIGRVQKTEPRGEITYSSHIAGILNRRCAECHREKELAPFPLTTYDEVVGWGETILEVVDDGRMPPWFADARYGHFINDNRMTAEEKHLLGEWVRNGSPEGDPADLPEPPQFSEGWRIEKPDVVFQMDAPYTVAAEGTLDYQHFLVDPKFEEDTWISMAEARPGNSAVVHHIVMYAVPPEAKMMVAALIAKQRLTGGSLIPERRRERRQEERDESKKESAENAGKPAEKQAAEDGKPKEKEKERDGSRRRPRGEGDLGQMVAIYAPGMPPWKYPEGTATRVAKGSLLVFQMHYTPNGSEQTDQSAVAFKLARPEDVKRRVRYGIASNSRIEIPPRESNYVADASETFREDTLLLNLFPHMHYRGKSFRFEAVYPDGNREILLDVPRYDFNWQLRYDLVEPKLLPQGTKLVCTASFDNSADNPRNPDPEQTVRFGLQSWEEMLVGYYTAIPANEDVASQPLPTDAGAAGGD